jgi:hypothetical protein
MRRIADGSTLIVFSRPEGLTAVRYRADGTLLSRTLLEASINAGGIDVDAFGAVAAVGQGSSRSASQTFWTMTWDGRTGRKLWKAPARFRGAEYAYAVAVAFAPDGDVVVAGSSSSDELGGWVTIRYQRKTGAVRWGPVLFEESGRYRSPHGVTIDPAGDVVVSGTDTPALGPGSDPGWALVKYAGETGAFVWRTELLGVPSIPMVCPGYCFTPIAAKVAFDSLRNVFFTVSSFKGQDEEWLTAKYDVSTGARLWGPVEFDGEGSGWEAPQDLAVDAQGDVIVTGLASLASDPWVDRAVVKYAGGSGATRWGPVFLSAFGLIQGDSFVLDGFGNPVLVGTRLTGSTPEEYATEWNAAELSGRTGALLWQRHLLTQPGSFGSPVPTLLTRSGGGTVTATGSFVRETHYFARTLAFRSSDGAPLWGPREFDDPFTAVTNPLITLADSDGNVVEIWSENDPLQSRNRGFVAKRSRSTGALLWGPQPFSPARYSQPVAALLDARNDVVVTGWASTDGYANDWSTVKYDGSTGSIVWGPIRFDGGDYEIPTGLALDSQGDAVVLGQVNQLNLNTWALVKYDGSSGAVRWGPVVFDPPLVDSSYRESYPRRIATDGEGNVFVASQVRTRADQSGWGTSKYDGATGALLWGPVLFDPWYPGGFPNDLAVDFSGDVVVTGSGPSEHSSWATLKYSGRNGAVIWGPIVNNGDFGQPLRISIDRANDVFVTGQDFHGQERFQWATIKYAGATGEVRWGPVVGPPSLWVDGNVLVSLDPAGNPILVLPSDNGTDADWTAVKYSGATGNTVWGPVAYDAGDDEIPVALAISGADFIVTGKQRSSTVTVRYTEALAIETLPSDVDHASCGDGFRLAFSARNGAPPYTWSLAGGALPPGLSIDSSGRISGEPSAEGSFPITVRVTDLAGGSAERAFEIEVSEGGERPRISVTPASICPSGYSLALDRGYASYSWLPEGQTSAAIAVCPEEPSLYGVVATDTRGCTHRASVELAPQPTPNRQPIVRPSRQRPAVRPRSR